MLKTNDARAPSPEQLVRSPDEHLKPRQSRWLRPLSSFAKLIQACLYWANRVLIRLLFRLTVVGKENIPKAGPYIIAPNHTSSLDPCAIAASVTLDQLRSLRWAAREGVVFGNSLRERIARLARVLPIERSVESLAAASVVLNRGENLVWFPEGTRSETGELQPLKPGIGHLACEHAVPVIPVIITGAHAAMPPPKKRLRRLSKIVVQFGEPERAGPIANAEKFVDELQSQMKNMISNTNARIGEQKTGHEARTTRATGCSPQ